MINNYFSKILGERRLKITKVHEETGISRTTLTSLYYGRSKFITFEVIEKLCEYLDCKISDLIEYEKSKNE